MKGGGVGSGGGGVGVMYIYIVRWSTSPILYHAFHDLYEVQRLTESTQTKDTFKGQTFVFKKFNYCGVSLTKPIYKHFITIFVDNN